ncbi:MAG: hypothetical protein EBR48_06255 [bacterium]|nr:hypothetical protein [Candidatus Aquidulcis frankliniae]
MKRSHEPEGSLATRLQAAVQARGQRWTEQRQLIADVLAASDGHATGAELVERVRAADPSATPSTVYRTLAAIERATGYAADLDHLSLQGRCPSCRAAAAR